nr:NifB/NifX family molybdenum-iron cluster-binding protein [uncultured Agathobaculum sp.]
MNIGVAYDNGQIAKNLGDCRTFLIVSADGQTPTGKRLLSAEGASTTELIKLMGMEKINVLICGSLGLAMRNALEMIGVLLVPGCEGAAEEAVAKFLVGERQGDPTLLEIGREEDPDDPMACMHDCAKCAGCGPIEILRQIPAEPEHN